MKAALTVKNLTKVFTRKSLFFPHKRASHTAVDHISFTLHDGEILGLLGTNGSGKTTTIQMLLSTLTPTDGSIVYFGKDFFKYRSEILQHVAFASTYTKLPGNLTVYENLDIYGRLHGLNSRTRKKSIEKMLKAFNLWDLRNRQIGTFSAGQTTRTMLAKAFIARPKIVLLDEPTASLDPDVAYEVRSFILQQQKQYGTSVLFTSHNMAEVAEVCNRILVLKQGTIIADDTPEGLTSRITTAHVHLLFDAASIARAQAIALQKNYAFELNERRLKITLEEHQIAELLTAFATEGLTYHEISIAKPTLEDYFLSIARTE